jgi:hypothetical protein
MVRRDRGIDPDTTSFPSFSSLRDDHLVDPDERTTVAPMGETPDDPQPMTGKRAA